MFVVRNLGFHPFLEAVKTAMAVSCFNADSAQLTLALKLAQQGHELCGDSADLAHLIAARRLARQCAEEIRAIPDSMKSAASGSRRALSALFVELDERIAKAPA
jgi:hypothetical protein